MHTLPPIEDWWPALPAPLKHRVLEDLNAALDHEVIEAVLADADTRARSTIDIADDGYDVIRLSPSERGFIRTQMEPVD